MQLDIGKLFEEKRQELSNIERQEAFLRGQLEEATAARLKLIGQLELLRALAQRAAPIAEEASDGGDGA
jgi:hypothetical protein